jgi:predicted metalloprotease
MAESDLDRALAGLLGLRDPSGIDGSQDGAHGNGFDRVRAFQDGFEGGATVCANYAKNPPTITESGFTSYADYASGGDMSLSELLPALTKSLQSYWSSAVSGMKTAPKVVAADGTQASTCGGGDGGVLAAAVVYCPETDTIVYDRVAVQQAHDSVGDFGAGVLLASEWSSAVQHRLGQSLGSTAARASATCLTGAYTASLDGSARGASAHDITLSPGDLDEVIAMLVRTDGNDSSRGSAFARVSAFRTGYFKGLSACSKV